MVLGSFTAKVKQRNHDKIPTFGKGDAQPKEFWMALIRQLLASGDLYVDLLRHGALRITKSGREILFKGRKFHCKKITSGKSKVQIVPNFVGSSRTNLNEDLLTELKRLRLSLAKERKVPAFVIFSDGTLMEMADREPVTASDLLSINGVGEKKLEQYGQFFIDKIIEHLT